MWILKPRTQKTKADGCNCHEWWNEHDSETTE